MPRKRLRPLFASAALLLLSAANSAAEAPVLPAGRYVFAVRLLLPELAEMNEITLRDDRCLATDEVAGLFPVLDQAMLRGCHLAHPRRDAQGADYDLVCEPANTATGTARLRADADGVRYAELDVQMGGKGKRFSQHTVARRFGDCANAPAR